MDNGKARAEWFTRINQFIKESGIMIKGKAMAN
jgi:hypothetical protein